MKSLGVVDVAGAAGRGGRRVALGACGLQTALSRKSLGPLA